MKIETLTVVVFLLYSGVLSVYRGRRELHESLSFVRQKAKEKQFGEIINKIPSLISFSQKCVAQRSTRDIPIRHMYFAWVLLLLYEDAPIFDICKKLRSTKRIASRTSVLAIFLYVCLYKTCRMMK